MTRKKGAKSQQNEGVELNEASSIGDNEGFSSYRVHSSDPLSR